MRERRYRGRRVAPRRAERLWKDYGYLVVTAVVIFVLFRIVLQLAWVPSGSMETTIPKQSLLLSLRLPYLVADPELERGDVVTFWSDEMDKLLVKRVVGLPGDVIAFYGGYLYINGEKLEEPYLQTQGNTASGNANTFQVPADSYFMMGDNRGGSDDSRYWAMPYIPDEAVKAKVLMVFSVHKENSWRGIRILAG